LSSHYRNPMEFSRDRLADARAAVGRMRNTFRAVEAYVGDGKVVGSVEALEGADLEFWKGIAAKQDLFIKVMDDDINAASAVGHIFDIAKDINLYLGGAETKSKKIVLAKALDKIKELSGVLGIFRSIGGEIVRLEDLPQELKDLVDERTRARGAKAWAQADALRTQLAAQGYFLEDRAEGTIVRKGS